MVSVVVVLRRLGCLLFFRFFVDGGGVVVCGPAWACFLMFLVL